MPQNLEQPPRLDTHPGEYDAKALSAYMVETAEYLERLRRRVGRELPLFYQGSATFDPPNLAAGAGTTTTVTAAGAILGDLAFASFSLDLQGITVTAYVSAADTVSVRFQNQTAGAIDLASGTLRAAAMRLNNV